MPVWDWRPCHGGNEGSSHVTVRLQPSTLTRVVLSLCQGVHSGPVLCMSRHGRGLVASGGQDGVLHVWRLTRDAKTSRLGYARHTTAPLTNGVRSVQRPALRAGAVVSRAECSAEGAARRPSAQRVVGRWWARCCGRDHSTCHQLHGACSGWGQLPVSCGCREAPHCAPHWLCGCAVEPSNHATVCYWRDKSVAPGVERGNVSSAWQAGAPRCDCGLTSHCMVNRTQS